MVKKILIITYYWFPAGGPGVQRWLKFVKYLPEFSWKSVIFTPENPSYPLIDESLEKDIPKDLEVIKTKIWEPYKFAEKLNKNNKKFKAGQFDTHENQSWKSKLSIWIRGNFFIPDARIFWVKPSVKFLKKYLVENHFDAVVTTGPPHSLHLIGLELKKEFPSLKWLADFRDPWTEISYYNHLKLTKSSDKKHRILEEKVLKTADITLATSFTDAENFKKKGANAFCITNGFDDDEIQDFKIINSQKDEGFVNKFTLSYIGVLEQLRNPQILWQVLEKILEENEDFRNNFILKTVGKIDDKIFDKIEKTILRNYIQNIGYIPHGEALEEMKKSSLLLITNFPSDKSKGIIPGKIFEYLASGKQIISFGPKNADVETVLKSTNSGKHFSYEDFEGVKKFILEKFGDWKNGIIHRNIQNIDEFSRRNITNKLVNILDEI
jgi:hypothetical protein